MTKQTHETFIHAVVALAKAGPPICPCNHDPMAVIDFGLEQEKAA